MKDDGYIPCIKGMLEKDRDLYGTIEDLYNNKQISYKEYEEIVLKINETLEIYEMNGLISGINLTDYVSLLPLRQRGLIIVFK